jgi:hypothetical protein
MQGAVCPVLTGELPNYPLINRPRSGKLDLTTGLELFDVLTDHFRREREAVPESIKDKILARMF